MQQNERDEVTYNKNEIVKALEAFYKGFYNEQPWTEVNEVIREV